MAAVGQAGRQVLGPLGSGFGSGAGSSHGGMTLWVLRVHADVGGGYDKLGGPVPGPAGGTSWWVPAVVVAAGWVAPTSGTPGKST